MNVHVCMYVLRKVTFMCVCSEGVHLFALCVCVEGGSHSFVCMYEGHHGLKNSEENLLGFSFHFPLVYDRVSWFPVFSFCVSQTNWPLTRITGILPSLPLILL